jgi:acyl-CoA thioesterase YciA
MEKKLALQTLCMPKDTNPAGDMFGGYLLGILDIAGAIIAQEAAKNKVATVGIDKMKFVRPLFVGDVVKCFASIERIGNTSITLLVEAEAIRINGNIEQVAFGTFTYVSIDADRHPQKIVQ